MPEQTTPADREQDAARRREWAAATRDVADAVALHAHHHGVASPSQLAALIHQRANRIEVGTLTPWADGAEPAAAPADAAQEPPAGTTPHADTPDGPGWDREWLRTLWTEIPSASYAEPDLSDRVRREIDALLADHVRVAAERLREHNRAERAEHEREQIRQELIEVKSDMVSRVHERDRYRAERDKALRLVHMRDTEQAAYEGELGDMRAKLSAAEAEIDELRELTATCGCGDGNPETYEGPQPDCPVHGAVRAFNEASRELDRMRDELDSTRTAYRMTDDMLQATATTADRLRAELATARRDGAANALELFAAEHPLCSGHHRAQLNAWAVEVRAGVRTIPTTTEGDHHDDH